MNETYFVRTCQECGHKQAMKDPTKQKSDSWRDAKCRKCKSEALDFGSDGWIKDANGNFVKPEDSNHE